MTRRAAIITATRGEYVTIAHMSELARWAERHGIDQSTPVEGVAAWKYPYLRELRIVETVPETVTPRTGPKEPRP